MHTSKKHIEIIIADDHPLLRKSLTIVINETPGFTLVGEATNGKELVALAKKYKPDIIITDIKMPVMDGIEATKQIMKEVEGAKIIALSFLEDGQLIADMLEAGASGYLSKDVFAEELVAAVTTVHNNKPYYSGSVKSAITEFVANRMQNANRKFKHSFSERDINIIRFICEEYSSKEIAAKLKITKRAVDGSKEIILKKMGVKNTAGLVRYSIKNRLYEP